MKDALDDVEDLITLQTNKSKTGKPVAGKRGKPDTEIKE